MSNDLTRRSFLKSTAAAGALAGASVGVLAGTALPRRQTQAERPLKLLILGGTGFIGPHIVSAAMERGHTMTLFNRGRTNSDMFPDLEHLKGNRKPEVDEGLSALEGRTWDAVVDTSGFVPRIVRASSKLLAPNVKQYVFISSISVYKDAAKVGLVEGDAVGELDDPTVEEVNGQTYGPLKALCEQAATAEMNGRATNIRPGYIIGPRDPYDRLTYWAVRVSRGGEILVPGQRDDPVQLIDARDLADFVVHSIEANLTGEFNAVGPQTPLTMGELLTSCWAATSGDKQFTYVGSQFAAENQIQVPIWVDPSREYGGYGAVSNAKSNAAGMTYRPLADTARDTLNWFMSQPDQRKRRLMAAIESDREAELLKAYREQS